MRLGRSSGPLPSFAFLVSIVLAARLAAGADVPPPTFSAETEVVTVDVLVLDERGQPVSGLAREDFRVLEDGKEQALTAFEAVEVKLPAQPPPAVATPPSAARAASNTAVAATRRTFGIVFDDLHLEHLQIEPVRKALNAFLAGETRPGDRLVLLTTSDGRFWTTTRGAESFARALEQVRAHRPTQIGNDLRISPVEALRLMQGDRTVANRVRRRRALLSGHCTWVVDRCDCGRQPSQSTMGAALGATDPDGCTEPPGGESPEEAYSAAAASAERSLAVLRDAIGMLGVQRERKALVLVSQGFFMDTSLHGFREVRDVAARANVVLYFLDARGLATGPDVLGLATRSALPPQDLSATMADWRQEADGARTLAEETGGLSLQTNDFQGALQRVADESRVTYLLGYEPPASRRDGRYHALKVQVLRRGLRVRARAGYFAAKGERAAVAPDAVLRALQDPFDRADVPLRLASYVLGPVAAEAGKGDAKAKVEVIVAAELREDALESRVVDGRPIAEPRLVLDVGSRDRGTQTSEWRPKLPLGTGQGAPAEGSWYPFATRVLLEPGEHRLRIVVESGGRVGSLTADLVVPRPGDARLSTPILSDALAEGRLPLLPIARRSFTAADTLHCWIELHGAQAAPDTRRPRTSASFRVRAADGREWAAGSFDGVAGAEERTEWLVSVPLGGAPAGENELALSIRDLVSGRSFGSREPFRVEPPLAAPSASATVADTLSPDEAGKAAGTVDEKPGRTDGGKIPLATLLERAGAYVLRYEATFRNLVADEAYRQVEFWPPGNLSPRRVRNLRSDVVFVPLAGSIPWGTFRDVYDVDGEKVHDRSQRLERLFARPSGSAFEQARAILKEGARYNLGEHGIDRTVNSPTIGLLFLLPQNQGRLSFKRKGTKTIAGVRTVELAFEEKARPTLVHDHWNSDVAASGSFWIDPVHGTVVQTRIEYDLEKSKRIVDRAAWATGVVMTEFRREPALDIFVPDTMAEWYMVGANRYLEGRASYSSYRRFQVSSDWEATETKPSAPPAPPQQK